MIATKRGDGIVLLDIRKERYLTLNEVGAHVWSALETPTGVSRIVDSICATFVLPADCSRDHVEHDVVTLLESLRQLGLLVNLGTLREVE